MKAAPIWDFAQAIGAGAIFLLISSYSILSTENMIEGGNGSGARPSFEVFTQLIDMWNGKYAGLGALAILLAFFLWFLYLGFAFYFEGYRQHLNAHSKGAGEVFITFAGALIAVDSFANWNSVSHYSWPWYWQLTATIGVALVLMYLGHFTVVHIVKGWNGMQSSTVKGA